MNWKRCKQCLSLLAMGALVLALLSGCGTTEKDSGGDPAKLSSFEAEVIRLVNEERAEYGLPALTTTDALTAAAAKRAEEISGDYGHDRPDGSSCFTVLPEFGIRYETAGENIAAGQKTPAQVVRAWMNSEGHGTTSSTRTLPDRGGVHLHGPGLPAFLGPDVHWIGKTARTCATGFYAIL